VGNVESGSDVLPIGSVNFDGGVGGGELGGIINQPDDEASGPGTAAFSTPADMRSLVRNASRLNDVFLLGEADLKILPGAGLPWRPFRRVGQDASVGAGVAHMNSYAHEIAAAAVVQLALLGAVAGSAFSRNFHRFSKGR